MNDRFDIITKSKENAPSGMKSSHITTQQKQTPRREMMTIEEEEEHESAKKEVVDKLYERKKRNFTEMQRGYQGQRGQIPIYSPMKNLSQIASDKERVLKVRSDNLSSYVPNVISVPSMNIKSNLESKSVNPSKLEAIKVFASEGIEKFLTIDEKMVDMDRFFGSGTLNPYFQKKSNTSYLIKSKTKYPDILFNIFNNNLGNEAKFSFAGLNTELNILYFVRDNIIYIWDYTLNNIYTYNEILNVVVNLHITKPKEGAFSPEVKHIMVVATVSEVFIIMIKLDHESRRLVFSKSEFVYDVSYIVTSICSTAERRIFLGSQNTYLFELDYSNLSSFLGMSKKAKKITHSYQSIWEKIIPNIFNFKKHSYFAKMVVDNTRHMLYALNYFTRSENNIFASETIYDSCVHIYDLGPDGKNFSKLGEITQATIKERYIFNSSSQTAPKKDTSFVIMDIFPITRLESKYYNLVIVTKNGLRAYITFDTVHTNVSIKDEEKISERDKSRIVRVRPTMKFSIILRSIPEPSNATIIEGLDGGDNLRSLQRGFVYNQTYFLDSKFLIFYKDDFKKRSYIDILELDEAAAAKQQDQQGRSFIPHIRGKEIISNILKFDVNKELYSILKMPYTMKGSVIAEFQMQQLLKLGENENLPQNINYLDSSEHASFSCMHTYSKQNFLQPEEVIVMTSSELVVICKLRPIDFLHRILMSNEIDIFIHNQTNTGYNNFQNISHELNNFINEFGIYETTAMLWTIICNRNFIFFRKQEENMQNESQDTLLNQSNIIMMDGAEIKNNQKTIDYAQVLFTRMIEFTLKGVQGMTSEKDRTKEKRDYGVKGGENVPSGSNVIGQVAVDSYSHNKINYITYAIYMYIARLGRLIWEEKIYSYYKLSDEVNNSIIETLRIPQVKYFINILTELQVKLKENKERILHKASEVDTKIRTYIIGPKSPTSEVLSFADFSNLPNDYEEVIYLADKFLETLRFVEMLYELNSLKRHLLKQPKNLIKEMTNLKFKDIILNSNYPMIRQWIDEYFESALNEIDLSQVANKLDELSEICPNILGKNDKELITANMLIRLSKSKQDNISKKNLIKKAITLMNENPESIKLEKTVKILGELGEVRAIVELCVKKAIHLKAVLEREGERNLSLLNLENTSTNLKGTVKSTGVLTVNEKENYFNEYKLCLYTILKLLNEIHDSIKNHDKKDWNSSAPEHIRIILQGKNLSLEEKENMHAAVIEEVLKYNVKFLHDLLFDHLKSHDMLENALKYESPYIEPYLSSQLEKEASNPKRYEALYKFYLKSKNYESAVRVLLRLTNFDNNTLHPEETNYLRLEDRLNYSKHLMLALNYLLESDIDENTKQIHMKIKEETVNLRDSYLMQHEILTSLHSLYERVVNEGRNKQGEAIVKGAIMDLDRNTYNIKDQYEKFGKYFKLYEVNFQLFFEMFQLDYFVNPDEVKSNYDNYFNHLNRKIDNVKWPHCLFHLLNKLFITLVVDKTNFDSFASILRQHNYHNPLETVLPLDYLVQKIENFNYNCLVKQKDLDFEQKSVMKYDGMDNCFWFPLYLKDVLNLPCNYIFHLYDTLASRPENETNTLPYTLNLIQIIKMLCVNVEIFIDKSEKRDTHIPKAIAEDYNEFGKLFNILQDTLKEIYLNYSKATNMLIEGEEKRRAIAFCQNVENKLQAVINYYMRNKRKFDNLNLQILGEDSDRNDRTKRHEDVIEKEDIFYSKRQPYIIKSNVLDQCD